MKTTVIMFLGEYLDKLNLLDTVDLKRYSEGLYLMSNQTGEILIDLPYDCTSVHYKRINNFVQSCKDISACKINKQQEDKEIREELLLKASYQPHFTSEELKELSNKELKIVAFEVAYDIDDELFEGYQDDEVQEILRAHTFDMEQLLIKYNK